LHDLSLHLLDLIENSLRAKATVVAIRIEIDKEADLIRLHVEDNGEGIRVPAEHVLNPFYTTSRRKKVGLGLSLFKAAAELAGGGLSLSRSSNLGGVVVEVWMQLYHVDRPPLGDLAKTLSTMILLHPAVDFHLSVRSGAREYVFQASEHAREHGLDENANVALANSVSRVLGAEQEQWKKYVRSISKQEWHEANGLSLGNEQSKLKQGADV
jgi:hypothetical protein